MQFITTVFSSEKQTVENKTFQITTVEQHSTVCCDYDRCKRVLTGTKTELQNSGWLLTDDLTLCDDHNF